MCLHLSSKRKVVILKGLEVQTGVRAEAEEALNQVRDDPKGGGLAYICKWLSL